MTSSMLGDLNDDGQVKTTDAATILKNIVDIEMALNMVIFSGFGIPISQSRLQTMVLLIPRLGCL